jgi:hypothetical protein
MQGEPAMGLRGAVAAVLCALCVAASLPASSVPAAADGPAPGEPQVSSPDVHRRLAVWTFPSPDGYYLNGVAVAGGAVELAVNETTGKRVASGTVTTRDFSPENLTSWDSLESDSDVLGGCRLSFYTSTDGGASWYSVPSNGSLQAASEASGRMMVRAELRTADGSATPLLRSLLLSLKVDSLPEIISLSCTKGPTVYKREPAVINSRVVDPDGDALAYRWVQTEGPDARLGPADQPSLGFTPSYNGPHTFRLSVSDGLGAPQTSSITVDVVNHPPLISFEMEGTPFKNVPVHIFASVYSADGPLARYEWSLVSAPPFTTLVQPTKPDIVLHSFFTGECTVSLTVTDDQGTSGTNTITFEFLGHPPRAALNADRNDAHAGQVYRFDASASSDADDDRLQYRFDFGDGQTTDWVNFPDIEHVFERTGFFTVRVRARDVDGLVSDAQYPVRVKPRNQPPAAAFRLTPGNITEPFLFVSTSEDRDGSVVGTEWDFGDGATASGSVVSHRFALPGNYTVRLWVRDDDDESSSAQALVNINRPPALVSRNPPGDFALAPDRGFNLSVEAVDPDGDALSYSWSVNGEPLPSETSNAHRFVPGREGSYDITIYVDDGRGGGTNYTWNLTILPKAAPGPQPVYALLAIIVVALAAQGIYLSSVAIRGRARRRKERPGGPTPADRTAPDTAKALPAPAEMTPLEWSPETQLPKLPSDIPLPELPPPDILPLELLPPDALPPEAQPPEAQPVMEEFAEPEPLAQILGPADRQRPYRRTPPPF